MNKPKKTFSIDFYGLTPREKKYILEIVVNALKLIKKGKDLYDLVD